MVRSDAIKAQCERVNNLDSLLASARACRICVDTPVGKPLPHAPRPVVVGSATARILVAGQAPGNLVNQSGVPFLDRSGDRLREWMGLTSEQFYNPMRVAILPMGFCFPGLDENGGDLPPRRECVPAWRRRFMDTMPQVELVLAIGQYAQRWHLGQLWRGSVNQTVHDWREIYADTQSPKMLPLPHPSWRNTAWLKRNPWFENELLPLLREKMQLVVGS